MPAPSEMSAFFEEWICRRKMRGTRVRRILSPSRISRVRLAPGLQLTQEQIVLLDRGISADRDILVKQEFRSGYSGAVVMLVSVGAGRRAAGRQAGPPARPAERVRSVRRICAPGVAAEHRAPAGRAAGVRGRAARPVAVHLCRRRVASAHHQPADLLRIRGAAETSEVLNRIFRVFGRHWWADNRAQSYVLDEYYDRLLPVHLQAEPAPPGATVDHTIQAGKSSVLVVNEITHGQTIHLIGFQVTKRTTMAGA